jgi:sucrose-6-phosphate hydrolase SacC (GH32 family)
MTELTHPLATVPQDELVARAEADPLRPRFHFVSPAGWLNDPNGVSQWNGTYHLFYQYNPEGPALRSPEYLPNGLIFHDDIYHLYYQNNPQGNVWGNMSWGHATSTDLLTWTEHPVAIACDENEEIFSGSIVYDRDNTSGFGTESVAPLVAIYTSAYKPGSEHEGVQAQSLAHSLDEGYTWTKHTGNPVLNRGSADFRDPKVIRYDGDAGTYWVMVAVEAKDFQVVFYKSDDLKNWELLSTFGPANATGGIWECPGPVPPSGGRRPGKPQVGPHRQPQPRRTQQRLSRPILRWRLRREIIHPEQHCQRRPPGP